MRSHLITCLCVLFFASITNCVPEKPPEEPLIIASSPGSGGEVQSGDGLAAERVMWRTCPKGYIVLRNEPIPVGETSSFTTASPRERWLGARGQSSTRYITQDRTTYRCVDPDRETPPPGSVLAARVPQ